MAENKENIPVYADRGQLDGELGAAISEILAAEAEARAILGRAEQNVKSVQLDGATRERDMRDAAARQTALDRQKALALAEERARTECERLEAQARQDGEKLMEQKRKLIQKIASELFAELGGDD